MSLAPGGPGTLVPMESLILPLMLVLMAGFMFFSIRNQKKRAAAMNEMQNSLEAGARVQLHSGLFATVVDTGDGDSDVVKLELAPGVVTEWNRLAIREVVTPESEATDEAPEAETTALETTAIETSEIVPDAPAADESRDEKNEAKPEEK